jgi:hypothetical protein
MLISRFPFLFGRTQGGALPPVTAVDYFQVHLETSQNGIAANATTVVAFDTIDFDPLGAWDAVNFRFTPPTDSVWQLFGALFFAAGGVTGWTQTQMFTTKNGIIGAGTSIISTPLSSLTSYGIGPTPFIAHANGAGDYFDFEVNFVGSSGTGGLVGSTPGLGGLEGCWFGGIKLS